MHAMIYLVSFYLLWVIGFEIKSFSDIYSTRSFASFGKKEIEGEEEEEDKKSNIVLYLY
jgi:hypothetical protein